MTLPGVDPRYFVLGLGSAHTTNKLQKEVPITKLPLRCGQHQPLEQPALQGAPAVAKLIGDGCELLETRDRHG